MPELAPEPVYGRSASGGPSKVSEARVQPGVIGQRLKLARAAAGLSLRDLQAKIKGRVSAQSIGKYERDEATPSPPVLEVLADALNTTLEYLAAQPRLRLENIDFRKKSITSRREEIQVEALTIKLLERYLTVEESLGLKSLSWDAPREAPYPADSMSDADRAARALRVHWGLGLDPIPNLAELVEERGIKIHVLQLTNIHGLTAIAKTASNHRFPVIVINSADTGERQRFTVAHEVGHMAMTFSSAMDDEKASHRFAGAFLLPAEVIWSEIGKRRTAISWPELFALKLLFGVSVQAIVYRCKDLGVITHSLYSSLFEAMTRHGWRRRPYPEPYPIAPEVPTRFVRLCYRALSEDAISHRTCATYLGISERELESRIHEHV